MKKNLESFSIKIHSMVDVITNSSSVIYTYSDGSVEPLKELIQEMFSLFCVRESVDDCFDICVYPDMEIVSERFEAWFYDIDFENQKKYKEYSDIDRSDYRSKEEFIKNLYAKNVNDGIDENWMGIDETEISTWIEIKAKHPTYNKLALLLKNYLYSTGHEASYDY